LHLLVQILPPNSAARKISHFKKLRLLVYPLNGALKLSGVNIVANQEIVSADLNLVSFVPFQDYVGTTGFQWNGSDGSLYALSPANVSINIEAQSAITIF
jgi:hypothetical protein